MSAPTTHLDNLLRAVAKQRAAAEPDESVWAMLTSYLEMLGAAHTRGVEAPAMPASLAGAMIDFPDVRTAFRQLSPEVMRRALIARAEAPAAAAKEGVLEAVLKVVGKHWEAVRLQGLTWIQPELLLARGAAKTDQPVAMQGPLDAQHTVSISLSGDPGQPGGVRMDVQCHELRNGGEQKPVPAFCLKDESGKRYHAKDRVAQLSGLSAGRHAFSVEVMGKDRGQVVVTVE